MQNELDNSIEAVRRKPIPDCPGNLEQYVLRRIRMEKENLSTESLTDWLMGLIPNTNFIFSAIALVVAVSALATAATTMAMTPDRKTTLNRALGFDTITMIMVMDLQKH